jgi:hypothetical protein
MIRVADDWNGQELGQWLLGSGVALSSRMPSAVLACGMDKREGRRLLRRLMIR